MWHNDYQIVGSCQFCGKPKFAPMIWSSMTESVPTYVTCGHTDIITVKREKLKNTCRGNKL